MLNTSFASWPSYDQTEAEAVRATLMSNRVNYWTGQEGREFEREFAAWVGTIHAIAVANGTLALDLALKSLGIGGSDEVIVTPRTFIASVSSVITAGATPVFVDVDYDSGLITPAAIANAITERTRGIIPVHLAGWPADMKGMIDLVEDRNIALIEDCAQAHGAAIDGRSVGSWGSCGAWSFCQDKIMTTGGEGGMVTCNDETLWRRMWSYKDHGKNWDSVYNRQHPPGFRWIHDSIGTNWRMLEIQAVIGRLQLSKMSAWTKRRTEIAQSVANTLQHFSRAIRVPMPASGVTHAFYRLYAYVKPEGLRTGWSRDRIVAEVTARGVPLLHGTCSEVYLERAFDGLDCRPTQRLPVARELGETSLMFLTHPTITDRQIARLNAVLSEVLTEAER